MVLGGLALAFSRLIDDLVVMLENIYRRLKLSINDKPENLPDSAALCTAGHKIYLLRS